MATIEKSKNPAAKSKWLKRIIVILFLVFIIIQFFQPSKNNNDISSANDISSLVHVPDTVQQILKVSCYDCHSNNTRYPWYTNIQPVGWWLNHHVEEGKEHLNFNEFTNIPPTEKRTTRERQLKKLEEVKETVEEGEMPLSSYTLIHTNAKLTKEQKQILIDWSDSARMALGAKSKK